MTDMKTVIGNTVMNSPIIGASGTSGWGKEILAYNDASEIGGFVTKSVTLNSKTGNDGQRVMETASGMLNSIGLENEGLDFFINSRIQDYDNAGCAVFVNLAPYSEDELRLMIGRLNDFKSINGYEINISCPNVVLGGISFNASAEKAGHLINGIRKCTDKALMLKLSPSAEASFDIALLAEKEGFDAISFTNTYIGTAVDIDSRAFVFNNKKAGLSGPAIKPLSLWNVFRMSQTVSIPVIGIGGIRNYRDVIEYIMAGAAAVQIGTGLLIEPDILSRLTRELQAYMTEHNISAISGIRGILH